MKSRFTGSNTPLPAFSRLTLAIGMATILVFAGPAPAALAKDRIIPLAGALKPGAPLSFADLIEDVSPAVVSVNVETREETPAIAGLPDGLDQLPEQFRDLFRRQVPGQNGNPQPQPQPREGRSLGTGFFISADGHIVTNNHVIENASKITVELQDGREFDAELIGRDEATDLAVLKIESEDAIPYVSFAENVNLRVGDWVVAVGNPFGLGGTATAGIVSAIGRRNMLNSTYSDFIQIDASINRGNSGGPTFDLYGNVVGVNSQILSPTGGNIGIGFAIPAKSAAKVTKELIENGSITRGYLGVNINSLTRDMADAEGLKDDKGAVVQSVVDDSPADKAGFIAGDIVLALDGEEVDDNRDLTRRVGDLLVGQKARFQISRNGKRQTLTVDIGKRPDNINAVTTPTPEENKLNEFGMAFGSLSADDRARLSLEGDRGILVEKVDQDGSAFEKGIRAGNALLSAGNTDLKTAADFDSAIAAARKANRKAIRVLVQTRNGQLFTALRLDEK